MSGYNSLLLYGHTLALKSRKDQYFITAVITSDDGTNCCLILIQRHCVTRGELFCCSTPSRFKISPGQNFFHFHLLFVLLGALATDPCSIVLYEILKDFSDLKSIHWISEVMLYDRFVSSTPEAYWKNLFYVFHFGLHGGCWNATVYPLLAISRAHCNPLSALLLFADLALPSYNILLLKTAKLWTIFRSSIASFEQVFFRLALLKAELDRKQDLILMGWIMPVMYSI